jgi:hypothetical protein
LKRLGRNARQRENDAWTSEVMRPKLDALRQTEGKRRLFWALQRIV